MIKFKDIPKLPDKSKWYRIGERENISYKKKQLPMELTYGSWVESSRTVVRVGYYYQPEDMPFELLNERIFSHIKSNGNWIINNPHVLDQKRKYIEVATSLAWKNKSESGGPITDDVINAVLYAIGTPSTLLSPLIYNLRGEWVKEQHGERVRTIWYIDEEYNSQIEDIKVVRIGEAYPSSFSGSNEEYDYEPPGFDQWSSHALYRAGYWDGLRCGPYGKSKNTGLRFVHPLDINWSLYDRIQSNKQF
jgi:hypothetical protein